MHLLDPISSELKKAATREGFGVALAEIGEKDPNVVALSSDVAGSVQFHHFMKKFPERFFNVGVAEQNLASVAAGLSYEGKIPFIGAFAVFSPGRNWEQIRTTICYGEANVKIEGSHAGLDVGEDGATHQMLEDIALLRSLPNMLILSPCDFNQAYKATYAAWKHKGPVYVRCTRGKLPIFTTQETPFEIGKINILNEGDDIVIIATGDMVYPSLLAAESLEKEGISVCVADMHTISEVDYNTIEKLARKFGKIITAEDHQIKGGLGSAVCEAVTETYPVKVRRIGVKMSFGESGPGPEVMKKYGLDKDSIAKVVKEELK
jgi:transketolase